MFEFNCRIKYFEYKGIEMFLIDTFKGDKWLEIQVRKVEDEKVFNDLMKIYNLTK